MAISEYIPTVYVNGSSPSLDDINLNKHENATKSVTDETILQGNRLDALEGSNVSSKFSPQVSEPLYQEGQIYYDDNMKAIVVQNDIQQANTILGLATYMKVINNTGGTLEKGVAVRHDGVDANGNIQVKKAIATSFENARVLGVVQSDIADTTVGNIVTFGQLPNVDTSTVTAGVPLFLSDTIAGEVTMDEPTISTQVGGALVSGASESLFVSILNHFAFQTVFASLHSQTSPLYSVTSTEQDISGYSTKIQSVSVSNETTGTITVPNTGIYRVNLTASISFNSTNTTRILTFDIYDITNSVVLSSHTSNIPRDTTEDSVAFSLPVELLPSQTIKIMVKSNTSIDVTFESIVFDVTSITIK